VPGYNNGNGTMVFAIDVGRFVPTADFMEQVEAFSDRLRAAPRAPGFDEILMPGEPEWRSRIQRAEAGIPVPAATHRAIADLAAGLGLGMI
jgi:LDH2 family malate/lactate/ureidoglycolate dehydrogenase